MLLVPYIFHVGEYKCMDFMSLKGISPSLEMSEAAEKGLISRLSVTNSLHPLTKAPPGVMPGHLGLIMWSVWLKCSHALIFRNIQQVQLLYAKDDGIVSSWIWSSW